MSENLLSSLNESQQTAAQHIDGPMLILAGAGSGKTKTITTRLAYLISIGIDPRSILTLTFTNKAAKEMRERIYKIIGTLGEGIWVSTFHSACVRILRRDIEMVGFDNKFVIYDYGDQ